MALSPGANLPPPCQRLLRRRAVKAEASACRCWSDDLWRAGDRRRHCGEARDRRRRGAVVRPEEPEAWGAALQRLADDPPALRPGCRAPGPQRAASFSWERAAQATAVISLRRRLRRGGEQRLGPPPVAGERRQHHRQHQERSAPPRGRGGAAVGATTARRSSPTGRAARRAAIDQAGRRRRPGGRRDPRCGACAVSAATDAGAKQAAS